MEKHITFMYIPQPCQLKYLIIVSIAGTPTTVDANKLVVCEISETKVC